MNINTNIIEDIKSTRKNTQFKSHYSDETKITIAILHKIYSFSLSEIVLYMKKEHEVKISRTAVRNIASKTVKILDEKVKTEKNVKEQVWYPFYSKSPIKQPLFEKVKEEDLTTLNDDIGYQKKEMVLVGESAKQDNKVSEDNAPVPNKEIKKDTIKNEKKEEAAIDKKVDIKKVETEKKEQKKRSTPAPKKKQEEVIIEAEVVDILSDDKNDEKDKKRKTTPRKVPVTRKTESRNNSPEISDDAKEDKNKINNNNDNQNNNSIEEKVYSSIEEEDMELLEGEVIGKSEEEMEVLKEKLRNRAKRKRNSDALDLQAKKFKNGGKLPIAEMSLLYDLTKINRVEVAEEIEIIIEAEIEEKIKRDEYRKK